jgi:hypothetical protein
MTLLDEIKQKTRVEFRSATAEKMEKLRALGLPEDALTFYRDSEPTRTAEIAKVRLRTIEDIVEENRDYVPGAYTQPCGYVVFATTIYGDAYCVDVRASSGATAPIVLIAHDLEPENDEMKREELAKLAKPIAVGFGEFLQKFVAETLDTKPLYPQYDWSSSDSEDMNRP